MDNQENAEERNQQTRARIPVWLIVVGTALPIIYAVALLFSEGQLQLVLFFLGIALFVVATLFVILIRVLKRILNERNRETPILEGILEGCSTALQQGCLGAILRLFLH